MSNHRPKSVGAYVFAGGFTLGVRKHFDVHCVLEASNYGVATMRHNQPEVPVYVGAKDWPLLELKMHEWDFVYGNPPCAAWSAAGSATKKGRTYDSSPLVACTEHHFTLLEDLRPKVWAWESVQQAWTVGEDFVRRLATRARDLGYSTTVFLHDAQYLGVPQRRRRMFCICHRVEGRMELPDFARTTTVDEALRQINDPGEPLENIIGKLRHLLPHVRGGEELRGTFMRVTPPDQIKVNVRGQVVGRPPFTVRRARTGHPAPVIMHEVVHPTEPRGLSIKELAALCGYPPMYEFIDARDAGQVGRGVCPPVAEYLARNVAAAVARDVAVTAPTFALVDYTTPNVRYERLAYDEGRATPVSPPKAETRSAKPGHKGLMGRKVAETSPASETALLDSSPLDGERSGQYIRRLLRLNINGDKILELVHAHFQDSKASKADIAWNRARVRKEDHGRGEMRVVEQHIPQPQATREGVDPGRQYDKSSLRAGSHGQWVHRDYGAHFFRWGFAGRFVDNETDVLDVGCGPDCAMIDALTMPRNQVPRSYVGVDLNSEPRKHPTRQWATFHWGFNAIESGDTLGQFDLVTCFEVLEHVRKVDGQRLLEVLRRRLRPDATLLLSTPVFNGKAAANHLHEWEIAELKQAIEDAGMVTLRRHGTFASQRDIRAVASPHELCIVDELSKYYSGEVLSCFLAPLYPDASRNNVWVLKNK